MLCVCVCVCVCVCMCVCVCVSLSLSLSHSRSNQFITLFLLSVSLSLSLSAVSLSLACVGRQAENERKGSGVVVVVAGDRLRGAGIIKPSVALDAGSPDLGLAAPRKGRRASDEIYNTSFPRRHHADHTGADLSSSPPTLTDAAQNVIQAQPLAQRVAPISPSQARRRHSRLDSCPPGHLVHRPHPALRLLWDPSLYVNGVAQQPSAHAARLEAAGDSHSTSNRATQPTQQRQVETTAALNPEDEPATEANTVPAVQAMPVAGATFCMSALLDAAPGVAEPTVAEDMAQHSPPPTDRATRSLWREAPISSHPSRVLFDTDAQSMLRTPAAPAAPAAPAQLVLPRPRQAGRGFSVARSNSFASRPFAARMHPPPSSPPPLARVPLGQDLLDQDPLPQHPVPHALLRHGPVSTAESSRLMTGSPEVPINGVEQQPSAVLRARRCITGHHPAYPEGPAEENGGSDAATQAADTATWCTMSLEPQLAEMHVLSDQISLVADRVDDRFHQHLPRKMEKAPSPNFNNFSGHPPSPLPYRPDRVVFRRPSQGAIRRASMF
ncbi:uncharacterized protein MONBRDRAFT_28843 [Monosiga brevicollis MX1]|uniref:Uncharacterized protein n=1 Tax=Monosiga brevicollis TaxID=81824 RepID=A9V981_MONBE|nr:uncharacterized protein MONBRDRAFT_28843 [Monosiga brevicollis MX1]EDQ85885.1 predicted protein [Monosiga brevicollis MX1]|eukprot:XP_001749364.1 hypothetical protein [Monosiga brevicollis MX1]